MEAGYVIERPNRAKASSKATRAIVVFLLLLSAALMLLVILGGWTALQGDRGVQIVYVAIYVALAYFISRWRRGMLPLAGALAIVLAILATLAGSAWFSRDKPGLAAPETIFGTVGLEPTVLGTIVFLIVPLQLALIVFAAIGFKQEWHVEVERPVGIAGGPGPRFGGGPAAHAS
jgi:hypothetical protein